MELTTAISLIQANIDNKKQEIEALELSVKMLQGQFQPELERLQIAEEKVTDLTQINESLITENQNLKVNSIEEAKL